MTQQISVRLPDSIVEFLDQAVRDGTGVSRANVITRAVERERQRLRELRDIAILANRTRHEDAEFLGIADATASRAMDID